MSLDALRNARAVMRRFTSNGISEENSEKRFMSWCAERWNIALDICPVPILGREHRKSTLDRYVSFPTVKDLPRFPDLSLSFSRTVPQLTHLARSDASRLSPKTNGSSPCLCPLRGLFQERGNAGKSGGNWDAMEDNYEETRGSLSLSLSLSASRSD